MDGLSAAASVIAVIQISEDVVSLCSRYLKAAKNAKSDTERLQGEISSLGVVLEGAQRLLDGPNGARLEISQLLRDGLRGCYSQLKGLETKLKENLNTEGKGKVMSRFGLRALKWPFKSKDVDTIIQTLNRFRDTLSAGLSIDQMTLFLDGFERVNDEERLKILERISSIQYGKHHDTVKEARTSDTCEWLLQDERFRKWEDASSSVILWLQGSPGTGKTFLTSKVIDHVQSRLESSPNQEGFAFFYCNRNEEERRKPLSVLRSYTRQLSTAVGRPGEMRYKLRDLWHEMTLRGSDLGFEACREQLLESMNLYPRTTLVLDALDECEPGSRDRLVETIEFLLSNTQSSLRVFISSRPDVDIRDRFRSQPNIEIQAAHNQEDIKKFVNEEIVKHRRWNKISAKLREHMVKTLLARSEGMFQWAFLQTRQLLELQTEAAIRDRLGKLPMGLKAAYDEIYGKIAVRNQHEKAFADRAFMWVMCACKPLVSDELLNAIRLDPNGEITYLSEKIDEELLLDLCNNLLVLDSRRKVWRFSHLSVTEYFEDHWGLRQAHCHAAKICLRLLIQTYKEPRSGRVNSFGNKHDRENKTHNIFDPKHSLQKYSRHHWILHVQTQVEEADPILADLLKAFLGSPGESSLQYREWSLEVRADQNKPSASAIPYTIMRDISPTNSAVFTMCRFSFYALLADWWRNAEIPPSQTNNQGDSLLALAAAAGCEPNCEALVSRGADVNLPLQTGNHGSALAAAAHNGHTEMVKYLINHGADVNLLLRTGNFGSALAAAAARGQTETVWYLIEHGADGNLLLQAGCNGSALAAAAAEGRIEMVKYLVEHGADVNLLLQAGSFGSALAAAAVLGRSETVRYLVEHGADVNLPLQAGKYGSVLAAAAIHGQIEIVRYLVKHGADVNLPLQTGSYGSALAAAVGGRFETVRYLVEHGADINQPLQTGSFGSALAAAAAHGHLETVRCLVEHGADVNLPLQTGNFGSVLTAAAAYGKSGNLLYLAEHGADVNLPLQTGEYGSALVAAAYWGWKRCVESLIDAGAKVSLRLESGPYSSALHASQTDVSQEDREKSVWWDTRGEGERQREKAEVAELLKRKAQ